MTATSLVRLPAKEQALPIGRRRLRVGAIMGKGYRQIGQNSKTHQRYN
jgi:hypothetical protein